MQPLTEVHRLAEPKPAEHPDAGRYRALVNSPIWQWYVREKLLPAYQGWDGMLAQPRTDTAWVQGCRNQVRIDIELPYRVLGLPTPLEHGDAWQRGAPEPPAEPEQKPEEPPKLMRPQRATFAAE